MTALTDLNALQASIAEAVPGQARVIRQIHLGLLANGHLLLESLPGLAKTHTVKALAKHLDAKMSRSSSPRTCCKTRRTTGIRTSACDTSASSHWPSRRSLA